MTVQGVTGLDSLELSQPLGFDPLPRFFFVPFPFSVRLVHFKALAKGYWDAYIPNGVRR